MTPEQKLKKYIILKVENDGEDDDFIIDEEITSENIDEWWTKFQETDYHWDVESQVREGKFETGLPSQYSRNYEAKEVATQMNDGSFVGWTYWYGGGKHGNADELDWIEEAYDVDLKEEQKLVTVRIWNKK